MDFPPFELLSGHHSWGVLDLIKDSWKEQEGPVQNPVKHMVQLREQLKIVGALVRENLKAAQEDK